MSAFSSLLLPSFFLFPGQPLQLLPNPPTRFSRLRCHRRDSTSVATMVKSKAIRVHELGGPEVLRWEEVEVGEPGEGEIRIRTTAVGVNFIDIYFRKGVYAAPTMPFTPGMEAVGVVTAVGPGLTGRKVGDVVAYAGNPMGSYAQEQILPAAVAVPVPPSVDHKQAASVMLKGMTAHVLLRRVFKASLECLASRGFLVSFGQSSGKPDPIPTSDLASKSLFLTRPSLMHYTATRDELLESAGEVFANVANGVLHVRVNHTYPLSEAAQAHADLEGRKTSGSIVLIPG
uniref:Enoyl reductase (ER) domain-containing protein n=1 Tax=Zea mays TaxID=4577 RepID=A0A804LBV9_MAIZE